MRCEEREGAAGFVYSPAAPSESVAPEHAEDVVVAIGVGVGVGVVLPTGGGRDPACIGCRGGGQKGGSSDGGDNELAHCSSPRCEVAFRTPRWWRICWVGVQHHRLLRTLLRGGSPSAVKPDKFQQIFVRHRRPSGL